MHAQTLLSVGLSRCNRIHFVTWLVNDLKLDFMHAFILIHSLLFFILARKTLRTIKIYSILQLSLQTGPRERESIHFLLIKIIATCKELWGLYIK